MLLTMLKFLETLKTYWVQIVAIVGLISGVAIFPFKLNAMQDDVKELKEQQKVLVAQTTTIGKYIEQAEKEKEYENERIASAPPGYRWDAVKREYVAT